MFEYYDDNTSVSSVISDGKGHAPTEMGNPEKERQDPIHNLHEEEQRNIAKRTVQEQSGQKSI